MVMIPKIIFQTWKTDEVPDEWKYAQSTIKTMNPDWKYVFITDEDILHIAREHFPDFLPNLINMEYGVQRADAVRYMMLYLHGGVYIDLDYIAIKSFDRFEMLESGKEVGLIYSNNNTAGSSYVTNSLMVSLPRSRFWLDCIEAMKIHTPWWAMTKHWKIFTSTGPLMLQNVYKRNKNITQILFNVSVPCSICQVDTCKKDDRYVVVPIAGFSWHSWDSTFLNWMFCNRLWLLLVIIAMAVLFVLHSHKSIMLHHLYKENTIFKKAFKKASMR
jgi:mannosyltransferase OCH1-like enzyme